MPIYNYECETCGAEAVVIAKMSDEPPERLETCECDDPKPVRVPAKTSFALKGRGWYKDGY